jgi:uncharacterized coiled-coil protein SlyX
MPMNAASPHDTGPQGLWKWVTPAIVLALIVYTVQITARLAQDEALLNATATTVKERTSAFEAIIKMEGRISVLETADERERFVNDGYPVFVKEQEGLHAAINERISRLSEIIDRLEQQLDDLIQTERDAHGRADGSTDFRTLRPHYPEPKGEQP